MKSLKLLSVAGVLVIAAALIGLGVVISYRLHQCSPYTMLGFKPVMKGSDGTAVMAAQAELCRHQIDVVVDGNCGKWTALGICELLCRFEGLEVEK